MKKINCSTFILYGIILIFFCLSFFIFLPNYKTLYFKIINPLFWFMLFIISFLLFKSDKVRKKNKYDFFQITCIYVIIYLILFYLSGLFFGFEKLPFNYSLIGVIKNISSYVLVIFFEEYIRKVLINRSGRKKSLLIIITCIFAIINITNLSYGVKFYSGEELFKFIFLVFIYEFVKSSLLTYLTYKSDILPSLVYALPSEILLYLIPVLPNINWFIEGTIKFMLPYLIFMSVDNYSEKTKITYKKTDKQSFFLTFVAFVLIFFIVVFTSGIFKYQAIAIMSNSMLPTYKRGDVFVMKKLNNEEKNNLKKNDIIAFSRNKTYILHRIVDIKNDNGKIKYITKGDNNNVNDTGYVTKNEIKGIYTFRIKFAGYPSVLLYEFFK